VAAVTGNIVPVVLLVAGAVVLFYVGVALPAVWSRNPRRRASALVVFTRIIEWGAGRDRRGPTKDSR
jgi:hypothetical protein